METKEMLAQIDAEISRLQQARSILAGPGKNGRKSTKTVESARKKRKLSPEARARIAAAQKARWAKARKTAK